MPGFLFMYHHDLFSGFYNDRIRTQTHSMRKIINTYAQQLKKRWNSMCYKHCASAMWVFYK